MYKLRSTLSGHESDVRGVAAVSNDIVVSVSRDGTARSWDLRAQLDTNYLNTICFSSPTSSFINCTTKVDSLEAPLVACGGKDAVIYLCEPYESFAKPGDDFGKYQLPGHQGNVCSLSHKGGKLISGSWDCTAKVWSLSSFAVQYDLVGHSASVWDAQIVDAENDVFLTCSADRTIRKWKGNKQVASYTGHQDVVRKLLVLPGGKQFASASNDCTIKIWDLETGKVQQTLQGHNSFIYDLALLSDGSIVSTAEDRSFRIWKNGATYQSIALPCISVWCVDVLPNDDIVVGGSDKNVYVFTADESRAATPAGISAFNDIIQSSAIPEQSLDDLKRTDIPGYDRLDQPGKEEGSTIMVKSPAGVIEAHQWSGGQWVKIGDVVNSSGGSSGKTEYNGKEYDYVFDVDIEDGKPPLKLPYNSTENPYTAAEQFLANNDLPASYTDEVVRFINQNTAGFQLDQQTEPDPYTGPSVPAPEPTPKGKEFFPQTTTITYKDFKADQLIKGFSRYNTLSVSPFDADVVSQVGSALTDLKSKGAIYIITSVVPHILSQWDISQKLIGFDLLRVSIPRVTTVDLLQSTDVAESIYNNMNQTFQEITDQDETLFMMITKVLCNLSTSTLFTQMFLTVNDDGAVSLNEMFEELCQNITMVVKVMVSSPEASAHKHFKTAMISLAAFLFDLSVYICTNKSLKANKSASNVVIGLMDDVGEDLVQADEEAAYRLCVARGNFVAMGASQDAPHWFTVCKEKYSSSRFQEVY